MKIDNESLWNFKTISIFIGIGEIILCAVFLFVVGIDLLTAILFLDGFFKFSIGTVLLKNVKKNGTLQEDEDQD